MSDFDMPKADAFKLNTWEERGGEYVSRLIRDLVLTAEQAAGVTGNLGFESIGFTKLQEISPLVRGSAGGFGVAQWTGSRRVKFEAWCAAHNLAPASDEANYGFLIEELTGAYRSFTANLKQCGSVEDACRLTHKLYETPADVLDGSYRSGPARLDWARRALAGAQASPAGSPVADKIVAAMKSVQSMLAAVGLYRGAIDADPGPATRQAMTGYRRQNGV